MKFSILLISGALGLSVAAEVPAIAQTELVQMVETDQRPILVRTKHYVVEITWRRGQPLMSVIKNGFHIIINTPAQFFPTRGINDQGTIYIANSGDCRATLRVGTGGESMIEVKQVGQKAVQEYVASLPQQRPDRPAQDQHDATLLNFQTEKYTVRVYRQKNNLYMNLYNQSKRVTELKQVPVTQVESNEGTVYRYDGKATVQAREDYGGQRVLLILQNNQIQYRGDGY